MLSFLLPLSQRGPKFENQMCCVEAVSTYIHAPPQKNTFLLLSLELACPGPHLCKIQTDRSFRWSPPSLQLLLMALCCLCARPSTLSSVPLGFCIDLRCPLVVVRVSLAPFPLSPSSVDACLTPRALTFHWCLLSTPPAGAVTRSCSEVSFPASCRAHHHTDRYPGLYCFLSLVIS